MKMKLAVFIALHRHLNEENICMVYLFLSSIYTITQNISLYNVSMTSFTLNYLTLENTGFRRKYPPFDSIYIFTRVQMYQIKEKCQILIIFP